MVWPIKVVSVVDVKASHGARATGIDRAEPIVVRTTG
jgi:hypothetical protein